jgi:hypothetical protein
VSGVIGEDCKSGPQAPLRRRRYYRHFRHWCLVTAHDYWLSRGSSKATA